MGVVKTGAMQMQVCVECAHVKIYVVMEKLGGDMLEMILQSPGSRLPERCAKYLLFQVFLPPPPSHYTIVLLPLPAPSARILQSAVHSA